MAPITWAELFKANRGRPRHGDKPGRKAGSDRGKKPVLVLGFFPRHKGASDLPSSSVSGDGNSEWHSYKLPWASFRFKTPPWAFLLRLYYRRTW